MLDRERSAQKEVNVLYEVYENKFKGDPQELKKLLIELIVIFTVTFYIRPDSKEELLNQILERLDAMQPARQQGE
jgi:hypothetical protein